jgi:hypothetical protein
MVIAQNNDWVVYLNFLFILKLLHLKKIKSLNQQCIKDRKKNLVHVKTLFYEKFKLLTLKFYSFTNFSSFRLYLVQ